MGLFKDLNIPAPFNGPVTPPADSILIWGGSSSVGAYAVQFARIVGFKNIVSTSSPHNFDYVKSLGATHVFDYKAEDVVEHIKQVTGNKLSLSFDATGGQATAVKAMGPKGGSMVTAVAQVENQLENINVKRVAAAMIFKVLTRDTSFEC
jgi:NADPH:quinone reductase-like Zn-dependent oxidoreductase